MLLTLRATLHIIGAFALYYLAILPGRAALRCLATGNILWIIAGMLWLSIPVAVFIWFPVSAFLNNDYELLLIEFLWLGNYLLTQLNKQSV